MLDVVYIYDDGCLVCYVMFKYSSVIKHFNITHIDKRMHLSGQNMHIIVPTVIRWVSNSANLIPIENEHENPETLYSVRIYYVILLDIVYSVYCIYYILLSSAYCALLFYFIVVLCCANVVFGKCLISI